MGYRARRRRTLTSTQCMKHFVNDGGYGVTTVPAPGTLEVASAHVDDGAPLNGEREYSMWVARRRSRAIQKQHRPKVALGIGVQLT
jgi:hypothetical protein